MLRQLEYLSNARNEHVLNTAKRLIDDGRTFLSMSALKDIINTGCATYLFTVPGQVKLSWIAGKTVKPGTANLLKKRLRQMNLYKM